MPDTSSSSSGKGSLLTDQPELTLDDLCVRCGLSPDQIKAYVSEGIIEPHVSSEAQWRFSSVSLVMSHKAGRLERDLGLNPAGVALALQLMQEIETLRGRLAQFEGRPVESETVS